MIIYTLKSGKSREGIESKLLCILTKEIGMYDVNDQENLICLWVDIKQNMEYF